MGRRKRFNRWVVRPLLWSVVLVGLVVAASWMLVRSDYMQARLRLLLVTRLQEFVGRPIRVGATRFALLPLSLEASDVEIGGAAPGDPPFAVIPRVVVEADLLGWRRPVVAVRTLRVERPLVHVDFFEDGSSNVPKPRFRRAPGGGAGGRFRLRVDSLSVEGGTLELGDRRLPLELEARGVEGELLGAGGVALQGRAAARWVDVTLPRARTVAASVSADLLIDRGRVDIRAARIDAPAFTSEVEGTVRWGATRSVELAFRAEGSTDLLYAMGYVSGPEQASGTVALEGDYAWRPEAWGYRADVHSRAATLLGRPLTDLEGRLEGDKTAVRFSLDGAAYRGGTARGTLVVDLTTPERPTTLALAVSDVDASAALPDQGVPIEAVASRADGTFDLRFPFNDAQHGEGSGEFRLSPAGATAGRLPIAGDVALRVERGVVRLPPFEITAEGQRMRGQGAYDVASSRGGFHLSLATERVGDLAVFLEPPPLGEPQAAWVPGVGRGRLDAEVALEPAGPSARITLDLSDAEAAGLRVDRARGSLRLDERWVDELRLELVRGDATLAVTGRIPLEDETGRLPGVMQVAVESSAWAVDNARVWLPEALVDWPVAGRFSGSIRLRGLPEDPSGEVVGALNPAVVGEAGVGALIAAVSFDPRRVTIRDLRWDCAAGLVTASGSIDVLREVMDLRFAGATLDLSRAPLASASGGRLRGRLAIEGTLGGTLVHPSLAATLDLSELGARTGPSVALPDPPGSVRPLGDGNGRLDVDWHDDALRLGGSIPGLLAFDGGGDLVWGEEGEAARMDLAVDLEAPDLAAVAALVLAQPPAELSGRLSGRARLHGALDALAVEASLPEVRVVASGHALTAQEPAGFRLVPLPDGGVRLAVDSLFLAEAGTANEVIVAGDAWFDAAATRLDLRLQATAAAEWLELAAPALDARGTMSVLAALRGTGRDPELTGQAEVVGARVVAEGFPHAFEDLRVVLLAYPGQIVIDDLRARLAGGTLRGSGSLSLPAGGEEATYRIQVRAEDVALRYPEGWLVRGDGELVFFSLTGGGRQIRGVVDVESAVYLRDVDVGLAQLLRSFFARQRLQVAETEELLATTFLNVAVHAPGAVRVSNNLAKLRGSADLTLRGTLASPVVFGQVEAEPAGELVYGDNEYTIERARLTFANPYRIEPLVDLEAHTRVSQYDVRLELAGPLDRLNATFTSDPPIPDLEILSLIATGDTTLGGERPGLGPDQRAEAGLAGGASVGAEAFLAGQATSLVGERVNRLFRFDRFRVAPLSAGAGEGISAVRVTAGKRLSKDVYVTYSVNPSVTEDQLLTVEWTVARGLSLVFTQNGNGRYAVDAQWEKTF